MWLVKKCLRAWILGPAIRPNKILFLIHFSYPQNHKFTKNIINKGIPLLEARTDSRRHRTQDTAKKHVMFFFRLTLTLGQSTLLYWLPYSSHTSHHPSQTPCLPWISYATQKTDTRFMQDDRKAVWSIPYVFLASFFPSLKQNYIAYHSSKVSSRPDCIFEIH